MVPEHSDLANEALQRGKQAVEAGQYRAAVQVLEQSLGAAAPGTKVHGEAMIWLVTAYEAAGDREQARELCKLATHHPQWDTRKQGKRLLYILDAPVLRRRSDWLTQIPDLGAIDAQKDEKKWGGSPLQSTQVQSTQVQRPLRQDEGYKIPQPTDPTQVETEDGAFIWVVFGTIGILLVGIAWFGFGPG
jgi:hypothetical protein